MTALAIGWDNDRRKTSRVAFNKHEMIRIVAWMNDWPKKIMCHGARNGAEVNQFVEASASKADVIGTDLFLKG